MAVSSFGIVFIFLAFLIIAAAILVAVLFFKNLSDAVKQCKPKNQFIAPNNVWLLFIPLFNLVYIFFVVRGVSDSLKREFADRDMPAGHDFGKVIGMIYGACIVTNTVFRIARFEGIAGMFALGSLVLMIIYWVKIAGYKKQLSSGRMGDINGSDLLDG